MDFARSHHNQRHASKRNVHEPVELRPKAVATFRTADDTLVHTRCGRPLAFQGVRLLVEADFYCYACLIHVTIPVALLHTLPVVNNAADAVVGAAL